MQITLSKESARRYVLGRQGLWPGRRWSGQAGVESALHQCESVQIDPISALARSHDITLWSRVNDYHPAMLDRLLYTDRKFFDFGAILMVYPTRELRHWLAIMASEAARVAPRLELQSEIVEHVRQEILSRGPLASRDFADRERVRGGFNTMKDSAIVLYWLWITGELATHSRRGFDRVYDFQHRLRNAEELSNPTDISSATEYLYRKGLRDTGLATPTEWARRMKVYLQHYVTGSPAKILDELAASGAALRVQIEGVKGERFAPAEDLGLLQTVGADRVPEEWAPTGPTTTEEVNLLAPLDNVIWDRARAKAIFDFEYLWEVYKPAHLRRWGYYTLPILWGDRLVGRIAPRLNRKSKRLAVEGFWLEDPALAENRTFVAALERGLRGFCQFNGAASLDFETSGDGLHPNLAATFKKLTNVGCSV